MSRIRVARAAFACLLLTLSVRSVSAETVTWTIDGQKREALVFSPSASAASGKLPLIFSFHGHGDDMENFQYTNLHRAWPDAIVVYFQGLPSRDGLRGWQVVRGEDNDRDLKLVDAALASLRKKYNVDDSRIYATGFSNGAHFTYLLWAERPRVFAAYAPVAGRMRAGEQPSDPRPLFHVAGARDAQVAFADQKAAIESAIRVNGVGGIGKPCGDGCTLYGAGTQAPVMTWIHQGGHEYPQSTSGRIAAFFHDHPKAD
jgi:polyhydroxybutyrate depolymerase